VLVAQCANLANAFEVAVLVQQDVGVVDHQLCD
jgi:hypothetical protein